MKSCKHAHYRIWKTRKGWTHKCLACGRRRSVIITRGMANIARELVQGPAEIHPDGSFTVPLLDVTTHDSGVKHTYSRWGY